MQLSHYLTAMLAAGLVAATPPAIAGQEDMDLDMDPGEIELGFRAGPTIPVNELADFADPGAAIGANVAWHLTDRMAVTANGNVDLLSRNDDFIALPGLNLWHYGAGVEYDALRPENPVSMTFLGGVGATTVDSDDLPDASEDFTETYAHLNGGVELGYDVSENVEFALRGTGFFVFADEGETAELLGDNDVLDPFGTALTLPITAEVEIALPN